MVGVRIRRDAVVGHSVKSSMWWWVLLVALTTASAAKRAPQPQEPVIEEVTAKQLERVLQEKDYVAVFWCKYLRLAPVLARIWIKCETRVRVYFSIPDLARRTSVLLCFDSGCSLPHILLSHGDDASVYRQLIASTILSETLITFFLKLFSIL